MKILRARFVITSGFLYLAVNNFFTPTNAINASKIHATTGLVNIARDAKTTAIAPRCRNDVVSPDERSQRR